MQPPRLPTAWTRPLQLAVVAYAALSGLFALTSPLWMISVGRGMVWVAALAGSAVFAIVIVGAIKRWAWLYDAVWALSGLAVIVLLLNLAQGSYWQSYGNVLPTWAGWVRLLQTAAGGALAVAMFYARRRFGPWGMSSVSQTTSRATDKQRVYSMSTPEGRAVSEEISRHFPQRDEVHVDLEREPAIAFSAWLGRAESSEPPSAELWPTLAERIVLSRVRVQIEHDLEHTTGNPHLKLARTEAIVLGVWVSRDEVFEPLLPVNSPEMGVLWDLETWLERELFVEYSDKNFDEMLAAARARGISTAHPAQSWKSSESLN